MKRLIILLAVLTLAAAARGAETPIPPPPTEYVTDTAGFLSEGARVSLNRKLSAYDRAGGHQIVVWIGRTTGGVSIEEWAVKAFEKWRIGRKGLDDGVLLVIMADDRKLRFEVGYGLEGSVPDITAGQIINDVMTPRIRAGDRDGAVAAGLDALLQKIGGPAAGPGAGRSPPVRPNPPSLVKLIFFGFLGLIFLFILITHPSLALYLLWAISSGGRGGRGDGWGGGGGDGGGFSGGGGRSGGGGASGSW